MSPSAAETGEPSLIEAVLRLGVVINQRLTLLRSDGRCAVMSGSMPLQVWDEGLLDQDEVGRFG